MTIDADGTSAGTSTATAIGSAVIAAIGTSAGSSTATAEGQGVSVAVGTSAGSAIVVGVGISTAVAIGTSAGTSTVGGFTGVEILLGTLTQEAATLIATLTNPYALGGTLE